jgi:hypothetical protein
MRPILAYASIWIVPLFALLPATVCRAQTQEVPQHIPAFNQIFKQPTGLNGYEDLVMAGDLIYNPAMDGAQASGATLTDKRRALADPDVQRALALLRSGLDKPIFSPRKIIDYDTILPEYSVFRALARLLAIEQYVALADGQTGRAIQCLRDGLRLSAAARTDHLLISELVGIAIDKSVILQIGKHLDQFAVQDCDTILAIVDAWLETGYSPLPALAREHDAALRSLEKARKDPASFARMLTDGQDEADAAKGQQLMASFAANPAVVNEAVDGAAALVRQQYEAMVAGVSMPSWQWPEWKEPTGETPAQRLYQMITPNYQSVLDRFATNSADLRLLGVHVAIRKYRWQYDRLPARLEQLHEDHLTTDPFTGHPLVYHPHGQSYDLYSEGPYQHSENGERIPDRRTPITTRQ